MAPTAERRTTRIGVVAVLAATLTWSFGGVFARYVGAPGLVITFWRMLLGTALFNALLGLTARRVPTWRELRLGVPGGVLFGLNLALFFSAVQHTSIANAAIIGTLTPVVVLPIAVRFMGEQLTAIRVVCALVAVGGVVASVLVSGGTEGQATRYGDLLAVGSLLVWLAYFLLTKWVRSQIDTLAYLSSTTLVGSVVTGIAAVLSGQDMGAIDGAGWWWLVALTVGPGMIGHGLMTWAQPSVDAAVSSVLIQGEPVGATIAAAVFLDETVSVAQAVIMAVVIAALAVLAAQSVR